MLWGNDLWTMMRLEGYCVDAMNMTFSVVSHTGLTVSERSKDRATGSGNPLHRHARFAWFHGNARTPEDRDGETQDSM